MQQQAAPAAASDVLLTVVLTVSLPLLLPLRVAPAGLSPAWCCPQLSLLYVMQTIQVQNVVTSKQAAVAAVSCYPFPPGQQRVQLVSGSSPPGPVVTARSCFHGTCRGVDRDQVYLQQSGVAVQSRAETGLLVADSVTADDADDVCMTLPCTCCSAIADNFAVCDALFDSEGVSKWSGRPRAGE